MDRGERSRPVVQLPEEAWQPIAEVDAPPGLDNLPVKPGAGFVGRDRELDRLDAVLSVPGQVVVQAVHGLGGIGKTTLVAHWAATRPHGHSPAWWITADTAAGVEQGLAKFAAALQPALAQVLEVEQLADRALQWLATHSGWLLILDNVADPADIADIVARAGSGRIVITSRLASGWQPATAVVRLDVLDAEEALALLTGILTASGPRDCDGARELCAELGFLPLAIEQAGAYMAQNPLTTPRGYLRLLAEYPAAMYSQAAVGADSERTVARIWRVSLDRIGTTQPAAADLLRTLAWYSPDAIPVSLCRGLADPPTLDFALGVLTAYSMITPDPVTATVSVHRLVQAVARTPDSADRHRSLELIERAHSHAADQLLNALPVQKDPATWPVWRGLLPHIEALASHTRADTATTGILLAATAIFAEGQGLTELAITYLRRVIAFLEHADGPSPHDDMSMHSRLAHAYLSAGRTAEAIQLFKQVMDTRRRILGDEHLDTLAARSNLASAYESAGRTAEAIPLLEQVMDTHRRILGDEHLDTLTIRSNLASAYESAGRTAEAIPLLEQVMDTRRRILGDEHLDTLAARGNLGTAYLSAGRIAEAIQLLEQDVTDAERILGDEHPNTLTIRGNLASAYSLAGRIAEAIPLFKQVMDTRRRILGDKHPDTLIIRNNLAHTYHSAGRTAEAIQLFELALAGREQILGDEHPDTLNLRSNLAYVYFLAGRTAEAIQLFEVTLADSEQILGSDDPDILRFRDLLTALRTLPSREI
ncbi:FxSxx-COOH system tetratricopeptide repeat protein [Nocardia testacea]|uniref:FxSxx-COOH system tetratricopeptide repeat protein n=1 Tax=Nocardia testacea TaxID=248551 RepID=UPI003A8B3E0E